MGKNTEHSTAKTDSTPEQLTAKAISDVAVIGAVGRHSFGPTPQRPDGPSFDVRQRMRKELIERLDMMAYSHFITLTSNHQEWSAQRLRHRLKIWDAMVNRSLNGPRWSSRPDERLIWIGFPEKLEVNAHVHLLAAVDPDASSGNRAIQASRLPLLVDQAWKKIVSGGSTKCDILERGRVNWYVTKELKFGDRWEDFILSQEFQTSW